MSLYDKSFYLSLFFVLGVSVSVFYSDYLIIFLLFLLLELFILSLGVVLLDGRLFYISIFLLAFIPGVLLGSFGSKSNSFIDGEVVSERIEVVSFPEERQSYVYFKGENEKGIFHIYTDFENTVSYADVLSINGSMKVDGDYLSLWKPSIEMVEERHSWKEGMFRVRSYFVSYFESLFSVREAALMSGLTFGDRRGFSTEFKEKMSKSGTTHIVALSGYNITILASVLGLIFMYFFSRRISFVLTVAGIILFTIMVGAEASIVRASIMGIIALISIQAGREYALRNVICITALVMVLFNPLAVKDIGFQLSFAALIGIVYLMPILSNALGFDMRGSFLNWKENLLTTFSAQVMVLPLIFFHFGSFSYFSILANILILEAVPIAMFLGFIIAGLSLFGRGAFLISLIISKISKVFLDYQIFVIDFFAKFDFATISYEFNIWLVLFSYVLIFGLMFLMSRSMEILE